LRNARSGCRALEIGEHETVIGCRQATFDGDDPWAREVVVAKHGHRILQCPFGVAAAPGTPQQGTALLRCAF
jgi:hypothetical protein